MADSIYDIPVRTIAGLETTLAAHRGRVMLIVNVASRCGFTPQYEGLERLYRKYSDRGLVVLGFPCNQFAGQEPGDEAEIQKFCKLSYDVSFPLFAKIDVRGKTIHPLYRWLTQAKPGLLGSKAVKWNFTKFLVGRDGQVVERFAPSDKPEDLESRLERALGAGVG
jgi:glutathione peroxidase